MAAILVYGRLNKSKDHAYLKQTFANCDFYASSDNSPQEYLEDFVSIFKPILYTNEPIVHDYRLDNYPYRPVETNLENMVRHFINKKRVFELMKQSGKKYDIIVSLRIDVVITNKIIINILPNTIYIPFGRDYRSGINDQIAMGDYPTMEKYMNIIDYIIGYLDSGFSFPHPEKLTEINLVYHRIPIKRVDIQYRLEK
jgi:hypothetical protein